MLDDADDADHADDPEFQTTALEEACYSRDVEVVKRLKPNRTDILAAMLDRAAFCAERDVLAYLLDLGAKAWLVQHQCHVLSRPQSLVEALAGC